MPDQVAITVQGPQDRASIDRVNKTLAQGLVAGPAVVTLSRPGRSSKSNSKYHAMVADIHRQALRAYSFDGVKAVLVNQFALEMEQAGTPLANPGEKAWDWKTQEAVYVRPSTTKFRKGEAAQFIEFLFSVGVELDVQWSEKALAVYDEYKESQQ